MRILAVGAHPDDLEILCGGTLARYAQRGDRVVMAVVTNGEVGSPTLPREEIAAIRRREAEAAAAVIGAELIWMDMADEFLFSDRETRLLFLDMVRQANPDVIFAHHPDDYHTDHRTSGRIIADIKPMVTVPNIETAHPPMQAIPSIFHMDTVAGVGFTPEEYVDVTETFEIKKRMLMQHQSQSVWLENQYGMNYGEFIECVARFRGIQVGVRYAEAFSVPRAWPGRIARALLP